MVAIDTPGSLGSWIGFIGEGPDFRDTDRGPLLGRTRFHNVSIRSSRWEYSSRVASGSVNCFCIRSHKASSRWWRWSYSARDIYSVGGGSGSFLEGANENSVGGDGGTFLEGADETYSVSGGGGMFLEGASGTTGVYCGVNVTWLEGTNELGRRYRSLKGLDLQSTVVVLTITAIRSFWSCHTGRTG